jgi:hypothetical protein
MKDLITTIGLSRTISALALVLAAVAAQSPFV